MACMAAGHIRPKDYSAPPAWSGELKEYVKAVYRHDGIWTAIAPANFVTPDKPEGVLPAPAEERRHSAELYLNENRERLIHQLGLFHA